MVSELLFYMCRSDDQPKAIQTLVEELFQYGTACKRRANLEQFRNHHTQPFRILIPVTMDQAKAKTFSEQCMFAVEIGPWEFSKPLLDLCWATGARQTYQKKNCSKLLWHVLAYYLKSLWHFVVMHRDAIYCFFCHVEGLQPVGQNTVAFCSSAFASWVLSFCSLVC